MKKIYLILVSTFLGHLIYGQELSEDIRVNQVGYFTFAEKIVTVKSSEADTFFVKSPDLSTTYFSGAPLYKATWPYSQEDLVNFDFSAFTQKGEYVIEVPGVGYSHTFEISDTPALEVLRGVTKAYYYFRCSTPITERHGGKWARNAGHPDTLVAIHASAASQERPEGSFISSPGGWYDAGDYNKYVVPSGITIYTLLSAYEHHPEIFSQLVTAIPGSDNELPDILDEVHHKLSWMHTMQDPNDGGVYHKLSSPQFDGRVTPENGQDAQRYVVQKSTGAALNFTVAMAVASRIYEPFLPDFADSCLNAATRAWDWARANPDKYYSQWEHNAQFDPDITTGEYGDRQLKDEFIWAAAEMYLATGENAYYNTIDWQSIVEYQVPNWKNTLMVPIYSLLYHKDELTQPAFNDTTLMKQQLFLNADKLRDHYYGSAHRVTMGSSPNDFSWGSNSNAANQGMLLMLAFHLTQDFTYLNSAISCFDYIMGRNATGYAFVTGHGDKPPMGPHHRPSAADDIEEPVPGMMVGGPQNDVVFDNCPYTDSLPATRYYDDWCSYSTNEIAINWNAPMVYLTAALQSHFLYGNFLGLNPPPPPAPFEVSAEWQEPHVFLTWKDSAENEHYFSIERSVNDSLNFTLHDSVPSNITEYADTDVEEGNQYFYRLRSQNYYGQSEPSNMVQITVEITSPPESPNELVAELQGGQILLTWADNSNREQKFLIERSKNDSTNFTLLDSVAANTVQYVDATVEQGKDYYYRVIAENEIGTSAPSNLAGVYVEITSAPERPTGLSATMQTNGVLLTWIDNSSIEQFFRVDRAANDSSLFMLIDTVTTDVTQYLDESIEEGNRYFYRVKAENAIGESLASNTAEINVEITALPGEVFSPDIAVFPNPASKALNIDLGKWRNCQFNAWDFKGKRIASTNNLSGQWSWDVSRLPKGLYVIALRSADGELLQRQKVIIR